MADVSTCPSFRTIVVVEDPTVHPQTDDSDPSVDLEFFATPPASVSTIYPVFGRDRWPVDSEEEPAEGSNCRWAEPPKKSLEPMRKSWSTGTTGKGRPLSARWWGLVFGRSRSAGKEMLGGFLRTPSKKKKGEGEETEVAAAHRRFYGGGSEGARRSSFEAEAYRKESVGFLPGLKGIGRSFRGF